jgi:hypothetical protein
MLEDLRELDYQIAEALFGLTVNRVLGTIVPTDLPILGSGVIYYGAPALVPAYTRDRNAAQQVIEKLGGRGQVVMGESRTVGSVTMHRKSVLDNDGLVVGISDWHGKAWHETEATAICFAVVKPLGLKWPEVTQSETLRTQ